MSYPDPPLTKNLTITKLSPQLRSLWDTFVEIEAVDPKTLFEGMLYDWAQKFMESRAKEIDVDPEIFEALEEGIEQCFRSTVLHRCLYKPIDSVPENEREQVLAKMVREK